MHFSLSSMTYCNIMQTFYEIQHGTDLKMSFFHVRSPDIFAISRPINNMAEIKRFEVTHVWQILESRNEFYAYISCRRISAYRVLVGNNGDILSIFNFGKHIDSFKRVIPFRTSTGTPSSWLRFLVVFFVPSSLTPNENLKRLNTGVYKN